MNNLSYDCMLLIFGQLNIAEKAIAMSVCKLWNELLKCSLKRFSNCSVTLYIQAFHHLPNAICTKAGRRVTLWHERRRGNVFVVHVHTGRKNLPIMRTVRWFHKYCKTGLKVIYTFRLGPEMTLTFNRRWIQTFDYNEDVVSISG